MGMMKTYDGKGRTSKPIQKPVAGNNAKSYSYSGGPTKPVAGKGQKASGVKCY